MHSRLLSTLTHSDTATYASTQRKHTSPRPQHGRPLGTAATARTTLQPSGLYLMVDPRTGLPIHPSHLPQDLSSFSTVFGAADFAPPPSLAPIRTCSTNVAERAQGPRGSQTAQQFSSNATASQSPRLQSPLHTEAAGRELTCEISGSLGSYAGTPRSATSVATRTAKEVGGIAACALYGPAQGAGGAFDSQQPEAAGFERAATAPMQQSVHNSGAVAAMCDGHAAPPRDQRELSLSPLQGNSADARLDAARLSVHDAGGSCGAPEVLQRLSSNGSPAASPLPIQPRQASTALVRFALLVCPWSVPIGEALGMQSVWQCTSGARSPRYPPPLRQSLEHEIGCWVYRIGYTVETQCRRLQAQS